MQTTYFKYGEQYFKFEESTLTMTIVSYNETSKTITVEPKSENDFFATFYTFKANALRSESAESLNILPPHFLTATEEEFNEKKLAVVQYITGLA